MILPNGEDHNKYQAKSFDDTLINAFAKAHKWKEIIENKNEPLAKVLGALIIGGALCIFL